MLVSPATAFAAFGLTVSTDYYTVDTCAGHQNQLTLTVISGSGGTGFLSAGYAYDAVDIY